MFNVEILIVAVVDGAKIDMRINLADIRCFHAKPKEKTRTIIYTVYGKFELDLPAEKFNKMRDELMQKLDEQVNAPGIALPRGVMPGPHLSS